CYFSENQMVKKQTWKVILEEFLFSNFEKKGWNLLAVKPLILLECA
ncbi:MAG: hypothetical protein ACI902_002727, partial [Psychroserpens sp.]